MLTLGKLVNLQQQEEFGSRNQSKSVRHIHAWWPAEDYLKAQILPLHKEQVQPSQNTHVSRKSICTSRKGATGL